MKTVNMKTATYLALLYCGLAAPFSAQAENYDISSGWYAGAGYVQVTPGTITAECYTAGSNGMCILPLGSASGFLLEGGKKFNDNFSMGLSITSSSGHKGGSGYDFASADLMQTQFDIKGIYPVADTANIFAAFSVGSISMDYKMNAGVISGSTILVSTGTTFSGSTMGLKLGGSYVMGAVSLEAFYASNSATISSATTNFASGELPSKPSFSINQLGLQANYLF